MKNITLLDVPLDKSCAIFFAASFFSATFKYLLGILTFVLKHLKLNVECIVFKIRNIIYLGW